MKEGHSEEGCKMGHIHHVPRIAIIQTLLMTQEPLLLLIMTWWGRQHGFQYHSVRKKQIWHNGHVLWTSPYISLNIQAEAFLKSWVKMNRPWLKLGRDRTTLPLYPTGVVNSCWNNENLSSWDKRAVYSVVMGLIFTESETSMVGLVGTSQSRASVVVDGGSCWIGWKKCS